MKTLVTIAFFLLIGAFGTAPENPCGIMVPRGEDEDWGDGAFFMPDEFQIPLFEDTKGEAYGFLRKAFPQEVMHLIDKNGQRVLSLNYYNNIEWIGHYSIELLMSKKCENTAFVQVLWKHKKRGLFVKKEDLEQQGAQFFTYKEYLFCEETPKKIQKFKHWANIGVNLTKNCLNLRKEADVNSVKIDCVRGNDWPIDGINHMKILEQKGDWAKVEVITMVEGPEEHDCPSLVKEKRIGWVKAIDESGFPNIWYSVSGY